MFKSPVTIKQLHGQSYSACGYEWPFGLRVACAARRGLSGEGVETNAYRNRLCMLLLEASNGFPWAMEILRRTAHETHRKTSRNEVKVLVTCSLLDVIRKFGRNKLIQTTKMIERWTLPLTSLASNLAFSRQFLTISSQSNLLKNRLTHLNSEDK